MNKAEIRRLIKKLSELRSCPTCGLKKADRMTNGGPTRIGIDPSILAVWRCPDCGETPHVRWTLWIEPISPEPPWVREGREERARDFAADGVTPENGWEISPDILGTMAQLELIEINDPDLTKLVCDLKERNRTAKNYWKDHATYVLGLDEQLLAKADPAVQKIPLR